jgi:mannose-6-phosphate isomerase-like protein (cupin superfamily)
MTNVWPVSKMSGLAAVRRVVTGRGEDGRSRVLIDGPSPTVIWRSFEAPVDNGGSVDTGAAQFSFAMPTGGTQMLSFDIAPTHGEMVAPGMHASDTLDYLVLTAGELVLVTDEGELPLQAGDVIVNRGVMHGWRNDGDVPARLLIVVVDALPVGAGATV